MIQPQQCYTPPLQEADLVIKNSCPGFLEVSSAPTPHPLLALPHPALLAAKWAVGTLARLRGGNATFGRLQVLRRYEELRHKEDSMVGAILVGDLEGKDDHPLGKKDLLFGKEGGISAPLPLLLVGDGQSAPDQNVPENVFVVNAHQMFLQQVSFVKTVLDFF